MIGLKKRIAIVERLTGKPGRLLTVAADSAGDVEAQMAAEGVERRLTDHIIRVPKAGNGPPYVRIHEQGLGHLLDSIDGKSKPLVKEPA